MMRFASASEMQYPRLNMRAGKFIEDWGDCSPSLSRTWRSGTIVEEASLEGSNILGDYKNNGKSS